MATNLPELNVALAKALGIEGDLSGVCAVDLAIRPDALPLVTVVIRARDAAMPEQLAQVTTEYELRPKEQMARESKAAHELIDAYRAEPFDEPGVSARFDQALENLSRAFEVVPPATVEVERVNAPPYPPEGA